MVHVTKTEDRAKLKSRSLELKETKPAARVHQVENHRSPKEQTFAEDMMDQR